MKLICTHTPSGFQPNPEYWEEYEKLHLGQDYLIDAKQPRKLGHHRKFHAFLKVLFEMQDKYDNETDLKTELKLRTGFYKEHVTVKGVMIYVPKSLSFNSMDQTEFEEFYSKCIDVALKWFIDCTKDELQQAVDLILRFG